MGIGDFGCAYYTTFCSRFFSCCLRRITSCGCGGVATGVPVFASASDITARASNKCSPTAMSFGFTPSVSAKSIYARNSSARSNPTCPTSKLWCPPRRQPAWANCAADCPRTSAKFTTRLTGGNTSTARWPSSTPSPSCSSRRKSGPTSSGAPAIWASRFFWPMRGCPTAPIGVTNDLAFYSDRSSLRLPASARKMKPTPGACRKSAAGRKPSASWAT